MPRRIHPDLSTSAALPSLESLLVQAGGGDREALIGIYDRLAPQVLGVIERVLGDHQQSEQVMEEVFVELWSAARSSSGAADGAASVAAWLAFRARARALHRLPRRGAHLGTRQETRERPDTVRQIPRWLPGRDAINRIEQRRALFEKVLGQLPRDQFKELELVTFAGRSEAELAADLGEPLAKVRAELRAAVRFLRHRRRAVVGSWTVSI